MANDFDKLCRGSIGTGAVGKFLAEDAARRKLFDSLGGLGASRELLGNSTARQLANDDLMRKVTGLTSAFGSIEAGIARNDLASALASRKPEGVAAALERISTGLTSKMHFDALGGMSQARLASEFHRNIQGLLPKTDFPNISAVMASAREFELAFRKPASLEIARLAQEAASSSFASRTQVQAVMDQINQPWARIGQELASAAAVGNLYAMGRMARGINPYGPSATKMFRAEFGDWRTPFTFEPSILDPVHRTAFYVERGYDASLTDLPAEVVEQIIDLADDDADGDEEQGELRTDRAYAALSRFERQIRSFIEARLGEVFGGRWEAQIPQQLYKLWVEKRQRDLDNGTSPRPRLIDYADFTDYQAIIARRDNWDHAFRPVFRRRDDVEESLRRLMPVRLVTMHSSIVTMDDELILDMETKRILSAISRAS